MVVVISAVIWQYVVGIVNIFKSVQLIVSVLQVLDKKFLKLYWFSWISCDDLPGIPESSELNAGWFLWVI